MTRVIRRSGLSLHTARVSLTVVCALSAFSYALSTAADDTVTPETAPPPPPSLAPESSTANSPSAPTPDVNPPSSSEAETVLKAQNEAPEPSAAPSPEASEAASEKIESPAKPEVAAEIAPAPTENTEDARQDNAIEAKREGRIPYYQTTHPAWGFELSASIGALGGQDIEGSQGGSIARAMEMQLEYQLPFLQAIGVLSLGPSLALYPIGADGSVTKSPASIWAAGGQVRYQARFFREQIIVPMVGFEAQQFTYHFTDGNSGGTTLAGGFIGAMLLLNALEPSAASELYVQNEISRSYLVAEYKMLAASNASTDANGNPTGVTVSGGSIFFGFRLEF